MKARHLCIISLAALIFFSCGIGSDVRVVNFSPQGKVKNLTTFTIEFSTNLAPQEKQNEWLSDEFIKFNPKIEGKFKWISGSTLIFSPDYPLQPIQSYQARITNNVLFNKNLSLDDETYEFKTQDFDAFKAEFFWFHVPNEKFKISVKTNIHFNYPVNPGMLKQYLEIVRNGDEVKNYQIISDNSAEIIAINIGEVRQTDKEQEYKVIIKKGLFSIIGKKALEDDKEFTYDLPPITKLAVTDVSSGFDGRNGWIEVSTTQTVDEKKLKDYISVEPSNNISFFTNENSLRIEGDFANIPLVKLIIKKGLPGLYGGELEYEFEQDISLVNLNPSLTFADKRGKYLMLAGSRNLEVNAVNIPGADVEISQVFKNNILFFLNQYSYSYYYDDDYEYNYYIYEGDLNKYGRIVNKETIKLKNSNNWLEKFNVNLDQIYQQKLKGLYVVQVRSTEDRWLNAAKIVSLSDLGIIAKKSNNELIVFVNSISTTQPISDVEINLISLNNQALLTGKTNSEGIIQFKEIEEKLKGFQPRVITAEKDNDFNYIDLRETEIETSRFDVSGQTEYTFGYKTFIYGDRNLYRPGEQVNIAGIVRNDMTEVIKDVPVIIKIISPTGKSFNEYKKTLNKEGSFEVTFTVPEYAQTGEYKAEVCTGSGSLIGSYQFSIEDFLPDKIRVMLKNDKAVANPGETVKVSIDAEYLFGAKASGLRYEADIQIRHRTYQSKKYPSYDFGKTSLTNSLVPNTFVDGYLDENGKGEISYIVPSDVKSSGIVTIYAFISVFDLSGRTVNRSTGFDVYPEKYFIGIKSPGYYYSTNETIDFRLIAVDRNDNTAQSLKALAKLVRFEWQTVLKKDNADKFYYASEKKEINEWENEIDLSGGGKSLPVLVTKSGEYQLKVFRKGSSYYQSTDFYAYGWYTSTSSSFEVDKEGRVEIIFDKQVYEPGEKAKILFMTPFAGKMLVTFERNGVYDYRYVEVKNKSTQIEVPIKNDYIPNIYVTATLFKKHTVDKTTPFFAGHGFASLKVEKRSLNLPVKISAPQKIKPNIKQEIIVKTSPEKDIYITLAAVDEGILQIKNYISPDPYSFMYAKRALQVESYDLYKLLLPEILSLKSSPGGDEIAKQLSKRTNPITTKRINLLAFWSGILKTDGNGEIKIPVSIPLFNGEVRLMVVAYNENRFGFSEAKMKVADDLIIEPQIPRFLATNDSLVMPVTLINTTNKSGKVNVTIKVEGPIKINSSNRQSVTIPANSTSQINFSLSTWQGIGDAKINIETSGMANIKDKVAIGVRPVNPFITETSSGSIWGSNEIKFTIPNDYVSGTKSSLITISRFPALQFAKHLKYLVGYPHGCIEQTVSKLFPQLYFEDIAKLVAPQYFRTNNPVYYIKEGIRKLESMQLWDGSLSYWPGDQSSCWWGSVYAAHFLIEAQKAGFEVSDNMITKLLNYLSKKAREKSTYDYVTYKNNSRMVTKIANKEIFYSIYVLALASKGDISTMNYYKSRPHLVATDCKYLLAGAFALMGKWNSYYEIVPQNFNPEKTDRLTGGSFDSGVRANAIMLNVLLEVEPNNNQIPYIVKYLSKSMDKMYSTQERSFAFLALGKAAKLTSNSNVKVNLLADNKVVGSFNGKDVTVNLNNNINSFTLKAHGEGEVYYFLNTEGVKTSNLRESDSQIQVRRTYYDYRTGAEVKNNFYQGELIVCKISLLLGEQSAENIAITDLIPSGFEIENPRLSTSTQSEQYKGNLNVQYMDVRDDRLIIFTSAGRQTSNTFYYMLRVVNKGKFSLPVVSAEAMYDPEIQSINGAGIVRVVDR